MEQPSAAECTHSRVGLVARVPRGVQMMVSVTDGDAELADTVVWISIHGGNSASKFLVRFAEVKENPFAIHGILVGQSQARPRTTQTTRATDNTVNTGTPVKH